MQQHFNRRFLRNVSLLFLAVFGILGLAVPFRLYAQFDPFAFEEAPSAATTSASLLYSAGGEQYQVDLETNSSTPVGVAPPKDGILMAEDTYLWMEMIGDSGQGKSGTLWDDFQIVQTSRDGSNKQVLLDSETFFEQFGRLTEAPTGSGYAAKYVFQQELVLSSDATRVFFYVCNPSPEWDMCNYYQLDLASRSVSTIDAFFGPGWIHSDQGRAVFRIDIDCFGLLDLGDDSTELSGGPVSLIWLADLRFVFSRHMCSGLWFNKGVETQYDIILANADGTDNMVLVPGMIASDMVLSPDQQTLAFISTDPSEVALWVVNLDGSGLRKVMDLPEDATDLRWYAAGSPAENNECRLFTETGYEVCGRLLTYWEQNDGLRVFGLPITPQQTETIEGQDYDVQWFERNRLELHPENAAPYDVLLGRLGLDVLEQQSPALGAADPLPGTCYRIGGAQFDVCGRFLEEWRAGGLDLDGGAGLTEAENLALFGLPLSPPQTQMIEGQEYVVQWFERARFEYHPALESPHDVQFGLLGHELRGVQ